MTRNSVFNIQNKELLNNKREELMNLFEEVEVQEEEVEVQEEEESIERPELNRRLLSLRDFEDSFKGIFSTRENIAHELTRDMIEEKQTISTFVGHVINQYIESGEYDDYWGALHSFHANLDLFEGKYESHKRNLTNKIENSLRNINRLPDVKEGDDDEFDFI